MGELDLSGNRIKDDGAVAFGSALEMNSTLRLLNLTNNSIEDRGLAAVAAGMNRNSTITTLQLWGNHFENGGKAVKEFDGLLKGRFTALEVAVDFQTYTVDDVVMIARNL